MEILTGRDRHRIDEWIPSRRRQRYCWDNEYLCRIPSDEYKYVFCSPSDIQWRRVLEVDGYENPVIDEQQDFTGYELSRI